MNLIISTGIFYEQDLLENLIHIRDSGFNSIELCTGSGTNGNPAHYDWRNREYTQKLKQRLEEYNLKVSSFHAPFSDRLDLSNTNEQEREEAVKEISGTMGLSKIFGWKYMTLHPSAEEFDLSDEVLFEAKFNQCRRSLEALVKEAEEHGIKLAIETLLPGSLGSDPGTIKGLLEGLPKELAGVCFDISHVSLWKKETVSDYYNELFPRIVTIHASDSDGTADNHYIFGDGNIDLSGVVSTLYGSRFSGNFVVEVFHDLKQTKPSRLIKDAYVKTKELLNANGKKIKESKQ